MNRILHKHRVTDRSHGFNALRVGEVQLYLYKVLTVLFLSLLTMSVGAGDVMVTDVTAKQRSTAYGLVDILVMIEGSSNDVMQTDCVFFATNSITSAAILVSNVVCVDTIDMGSGTCWLRRFVWNAESDLGEVNVGDVDFAVEVKRGVRLWKNGPYWAERNLGASKPEGYGYYFYWSDVVGYARKGNSWVSSTGVSTVNMPSISSGAMNCFVSELKSQGYVDSQGDLTEKYDAATVHLGGSWRIPTDEELSDLANCSSTWTTRNGVYGRLVRGKDEFSSNSIFLPAAGYVSGSDLLFTGSIGYYWSSTPYSYDHYQALYLSVTSDSLRGQQHTGRTSRFTVRPLRSGNTGNVLKAISLTHLTLDCRRTRSSDVSIPYVWLKEKFPDIGDDDADYETKSNENAVNGLSVSDCYVAGLGVSEDAGDLKALIDVSDGKVRISWNPNLNSGVVTRIYRVYGRTKLGVGDWEVPIKPWHRFFKVTVAMPTGAEGEETAVVGEGFVPQELASLELGGVQLWDNGPYWAECNVGAAHPGDYGYYFWWGDTVGYTPEGGEWNNFYSGYTGVTLVSSHGDEISKTRSPFSETECPTYNKTFSLLQNLGYVDLTTNLVAQYDAATVHLGSPWRMPTCVEFAELFNNCTAMWITTNGVSGMLFSGKGAYVSNSIFLPAAGEVEAVVHKNLGKTGSYWTSTTYAGSYVSNSYVPNSNNSCGFVFSSGGKNRCDYSRYDGVSIRPVRDFAK